MFSHDSWGSVSIRVDVAKGGVLAEPPALSPLNQDLPSDVDLLPDIPELTIAGKDCDDDRLQTVAKTLLSHAEFSRNVDEFLGVLRQSVGHRLVGVDRMILANAGSTLASTNPAVVGILFSGGVDCSLIAAVVDSLLPDEVSVDLLNVAFQPLATRGMYRRHRWP